MYKIIIVKFIDENSQIGYKSFTYADMSASNSELLNAVNNYIGYQDLYPLDINIKYGKLLETYIRPCTLALNQRVHGIQFIVSDSEILNDDFPIFFPIFSNENGINPTFLNIANQIRFAEHILLE